MGRIEIAVGDNGMVTLWLDNPGKLNALNETMLATLTEGIQHHGAQAACRLIVIRGRNGTFCAGRDVAGLQRTEGSAPPDALEQIRPARELAEALIDCPVPTIAAVAGRAAGLGMGMVVWCDMAICETGATFSVPEARIGIPPSMIALSLVRAIGPRATADLGPLIERIGRSADALEKMGNEAALASANAGKTVDSVGADIKRFTADSLPEVQRLLGEMSVLATSLRRLSEKIEGSPGGLLMGRRPVPPGPGEEQDK